MQFLTKLAALKKVESIRKRVVELDKRFRRDNPSLCCYIDHEKDISECAVGYFRDKVVAHIRKRDEMTKSANRIESRARNQLELF